MRCGIALLLLSLLGCGDDQQPAEQEITSCVYGPAVAGASISPAGLDAISLSGQGRVAETTPNLLVTLNSFTVSLFGVGAGLMPGEEVSVMATYTFGFAGSSSVLATLTDAEGLLAAAWSTTSWSDGVISGWTLGYENDACGNPDLTELTPGETQTPTKTLTAASIDGTVVLANGTSAELGDYVVTNGNSHFSRRQDKSPVRYQGSIVRRHL